MSSQIKKKFIEANAIDGSKILMNSDEALRIKKASGTEEQSVFKLDAQDKLQFLIAPRISADPTDNDELARKGYVDQKIADLVDGAPALLDTLNELAAAIGDDENFATTISNALSGLSTDISNEATARADEDLTFVKLDGSRTMSGALKVASTIYETSVENWGFASKYTTEAISYIYPNPGQVFQPSGNEFVIETANETLNEFLNTSIIAKDLLLGAAKVQFGLSDYTNYNAPVFGTVESDSGDMKIASEVALKLSAATQIKAMSELSMESNKIVGLADGTDAGHAVNKGQLDSAVSAEETRAMGAEGVLAGRVLALENVAVQFSSEKMTLSAEDVTNGYVDLAHTAVGNSMNAFVDRLAIHETDDYTLSVVGGVTRVTFAGSLVTPGQEKLSAGDVVRVKYAYEVL